jgi:hypothetical protein
MRRHGWLAITIVRSIFGSIQTSSFSLIILALAIHNCLVMSQKW